MTNIPLSTIQNHLNKKYQSLEKNNVKEIEISANGLTGDLVIEDYRNLETIKIVSSIDSRQKGKLTNITVKNLPNLGEVSIILCNLESLTFEICPNLHTLRLRGNKLTNLNFLNGLELDSLTYLSIVNNNIQEQDLEFFRPFTNLETLSIGNEPISLGDKRGNNQFKGTLEPLSNLTKLKYLHISKTNINDGLDSLPLSVERIYCDGKTDFVKPRTKNYQCSNLENQLRNGNWRNAQFIENRNYFSIESSNLEIINNAIENALSNFNKEDIDHVIRRRINLLPMINQTSQELPFWTDPATANRIAFWNSSAVTIAFIIALIVGIPAFLTLNKSRS